MNRCAKEKPTSDRAQARSDYLPCRSNAALLILELRGIKIDQAGEGMAAAIGSPEFENVGLACY